MCVFVYSSLFDQVVSSVIISFVTQVVWDASKLSNPVRKLKHILKTGNALAHWKFCCPSAFYPWVKNKRNLFSFVYIAVSTSASRFSSWSIVLENSPRLIFIWPPFIDNVFFSRVMKSMALTATSRDDMCLTSSSESCPTFSKVAHFTFDLLLCDF